MLLSRNSNTYISLCEIATGMTKMWLIFWTLPIILGYPNTTLLKPALLQHKGHSFGYWICFRNIAFKITQYDMHMPEIMVVFFVTHRRQKHLDYGRWHTKETGNRNATAISENCYQPELHTCYWMEKRILRKRQCSFLNMRCSIQ
jgi:hypothetical protein